MNPSAVYLHCLNLLAILNSSSRLCSILVDTRLRGEIAGEHGQQGPQVNSLCEPQVPEEGYKAGPGRAVLQL